MYRWQQALLYLRYCVSEDLLKVAKKIRKARTAKKYNQKLTHKQQAQVEQNIEKRIETLRAEGAVEAIVISHLGYQVICQCLEQDTGQYLEQHPEQRLGQQYGELLLCDWRQNMGALCVGDRVLLTLEAETGMVEALLPRKNMIEKYNSYKGMRPLAANIDLLLVVVTVEPLLQTSLLDRYLVAATALGLETLIFFNKCDVLATVDANTKQSIDNYQQIYQSIADCQWLNGSAKKGLGLTEIKQQLADKITVITGQSGVGKSSLINALIPDLNIQTMTISEISKLGRHSTTNSTLYHLEKIGGLIDTPGVRSFETSYFDKSAIEAGFREIAPFLGGCHFSDCSHTHEKNCSIISALENKEISQLRYDSFIQMLSELDKNQ